jgi:hypothetical protein
MAYGLPIPRSSQQPATSAANRREAGRVLVNGDVRCNLGQVIDLSATGMRLQSPRRLANVLMAEIRTRSVALQIPAEVVWCKRVGFRRHLAGLRFLDLDDRIGTALMQIASMHRLHDPR